MNGSEPKDSVPADQPAEAGAPATGRTSATHAGTGDIHAYIGTRLREVYDDVARQPIPDRFLELMRQLEAK